jgi:hypothetical protein
VGDEAYTVNTDFKTYFVRPDKVRSEWQTGGEPFNGQITETNVIWSSGSKTKDISFGRQREHKSLSMALASAHGVSSGAVSMILTLLLPEGLGLNPTGYWGNMTDTRLLGEQEVSGFKCYHIVGSTLDKDDAEVLIDKEDFLVRSLRTRHVMTSEMRKSSHNTALEVAKTSGIPQGKLDLLERAYACASLAGSTSSPYYNKYKYSKVSINEALSDDLFTSGPNE